jgi:16S rRNA (adenine1518-N6/adenine1519-N6)-dimethyltransferase
MARPRQTLSYLRGLFDRHGMAPQRQYGQNFLIDLNIHDLIARTAELGPGDVVLEVGPGAGALTALMAEEAGAVVAVDIDPAMAGLAREAAGDLPNVRVLNLDAMKGKNRLNPVMIDSVMSGLAAAPGRRLKLVANLPYNIATPLIVNLLVHPEPAPVPERMVVTIQLELAERMLAAPGAGAYGSLSVMIQALTDVEVVRTLSPKVFWPRPKVDSAVVKIVPSASKRAAIPDLPWFHAVVRRIFLHRRKNLRKVLHAAWRDRWDKPEIDAMLGELGLEPQVRAEAMNVEELIDLAEAMKRRLGDGADADPGDGDDAADAPDNPDRPVGPA